MDSHEAVDWLRPTTGNFSHNATELCGFFIGYSSSTTSIDGSYVLRKFVEYSDDDFMPKIGHGDEGDGRRWNVIVGAVGEIVGDGGCEDWCRLRTASESPA
ncbi:hypothetical protein F0562_012074 [Nyssa sinensis]|uniref:Uncharacterized protein n=1 Tax=Nyssa sinensis TaxID=561372 RepID=A0A5J4ZU23_9ASTE|nr:hypothetical protein F0562_012074 [Nyssa sinensis]